MANAYFGELDKSVDAVAVIMAGGHGTRFWPASRRDFPKQFLPLSGDARSLIQATADRLEALCTRKGLLVVTSENHRSLVEEHLPGVAILAEPVGRNTAPCIGFAAHKVLSEVGDVPIFCLPADHVIKGDEKLREVLARGAELAKNEDVLVTIGIPPTAPETGYGYIKAAAGEGVAREVEQFVEKPDIETAKSYLESGEYFWNSGMFIWRPSTILAAIEQHVPALAKALGEIAPCFGQPDEFERIEALYREIQPVSIDVGVMEQAERVLMLPGESFVWNDVGSWSAWAEVVVEESKSQGNISEGDNLLIDSKNCVVVAKKRLVAGVGLEDLVVVETEDAILVCHRNDTQSVKKVVEALEEKGRTELL